MSAVRTVMTSWGSPLRIAAVAVGALMVASPAATARSVSDPDIGWPSALRQELRLPKVSSKPCDRRLSRTGMRLQDRIDRAGNPRDALYRIFHNGPTNIWGNVWYLPCDGGRLQIGVASGGTAGDTRAAVRAARRLLERRGLTRDVRLVAVRSTYRELSDQVIALGTLTETFEDQRRVEFGIRPSRNAVVIRADHRISAADRERLREFARTAPVNVILHVERAPDPNAPIPTYATTFVLDRSTVDRNRRTVTVTVADPSCGAKGADDVAGRFAGVRIRTLAHAYLLTARLRVDPTWDGGLCTTGPPPGSKVTTTVTLPAKLGRRGIVDGAEGPGGFRFVAFPPADAKAIRSLVPKYIYGGTVCGAPDVRRAFKGRRKDEWCFF